MRRLSAIAALIFFGSIFPLISFAQEQPSWVVQSLNQIIPGAPVGSVDIVGNTATGTNGIFVQYGNATLTADNARLDYETGETVADGNVRIEEGNQIWVGEHMRYNFKTHQMQSEQFRMGKPPVFAHGGQLQGDITNKTYSARHALVTTDDVSDPAVYVRASRIKIVPGQIRLFMTNETQSLETFSSSSNIAAVTSSINLPKVLLVVVLIFLISWSTFTSFLSFLIPS